MAGGDPIFGGLHCLVLDDEFLIALDVQHLLETAGAANVTCAGSLKEAMEAVSGTSKYDVAILDLKLGGAKSVGNMAEGLQVATQLAARKIPFVFLTGMRAEELPADTYPGVPVVEKPFQAQHLLDALRKVLAR